MSRPEEHITELVGISILEAEAMGKVKESMVRKITIRKQVFNFLPIWLPRAYLFHIYFDLIFTG